jgi:hypothetical protein
VWQAASAPEGKPGIARAVLRYEDTAKPHRLHRTTVPELDGRLLSYTDLRNT